MKLYGYAPKPTPINATGCVGRQIAAADSRANDVWAAYAMLAERLLRSDRVTCAADALALVDDVTELYEVTAKIDRLAPRWRPESGADEAMRQALARDGVTLYQSADRAAPAIDIVKHELAQFAKTLENAGVSLPASNYVLDRQWCLELIAMGA